MCSVYSTLILTIEEYFYVALYTYSDAAIHLTRHPLYHVTNSVDLVMQTLVNTVQHHQHSISMTLSPIHQVKAH